MTHIQIRRRGEDTVKSFEDQNIITIADLKRKINENDPSSVLLTFKGKILTDSTPIKALGEEVLFIMENDIEFSAIYKQPKLYKSVVNNQVMFLKEDEIFFKDGKPFFITKKRRKFKVKDVVEFIKNNITKTHLIQLILLMGILLTKNYPLIIIITAVNTLRLQSFFLTKSKIWETMGNHLTYSLFMFLASMFSIDHPKFIKKPVEKPL